MGGVMKIIDDIFKKFFIFLFFNASVGYAAPSISVAQSQAGILQSDGKVVVVGNATIGNAQQFLLNRYNTDGSYDASFGTSANGLITTAIGSRAEATSIVVQSDGKLLVVGFAIIDNNTVCAIVRYNTDGSLDTTFGQNGNGIVTQTIGEGCAGYSCTLQSDGSIVVAGAAVIQGGSEFILMRYTSAGILDTTFGTNGIVTTQLGIGASAQSIAIQSNGQILLGGFARLNSAWQIAIARYNIDGTLDSSFGTNGIVTTTSGSESAINSIVLDASENIIGVGYSDTNIFVARYLPSGSLDTTFGTNGITVQAIGSNALANSIALQTDGSLVVTGLSDSNLAVLQYTTAGSLDSSFATNGIALISNAQGVDGIIQSDGNIIAIGFNDTDITVARYTAAGVLDQSWGTLGIVDDPAGTNSSVPVFISDQKSIGTNGGTFTAGAWQTRDLTVISAITSNISLRSNQIILQPGTYTIQINAPAYKVGLHQVRLQNITTGSTIAYGSSAIANSSGSTTYSVIETNISIGTATTLAIQHQCTTTEANDGYGIAGGFGNEVYTTVKITNI